MCRLKSAIILKDRVFVPDYDSHGRMLEELGIKDTKKNAERLFVRAELTPPDGDIFGDVDTWRYCVDQDILPDWYVEEYDKSRTIDAVKRWQNEHVHVDAKNITITGGTHYIKNSTVNAYDGSTVYACDSSTVNACGDSTVNACDSSTVNACDSSTVYACDSSTVIIKNESLTSHENISIFDGAIVIDHKTKTVMTCQGWEFKKRDKI